MGVVVRGCTTPRSDVKRLGTRDAASRLRVKYDGYDEFLAIRERGLRPRRRRRPGPRRSLRKCEEGPREVPATACALGVEQRERDILPSTSIYGISALRPIYIYNESSTHGMREQAE